MKKEIKITPPEGYEIDKENSTFECIKFKPITSKRFIDDENKVITGYYINKHSSIVPCNAYNSNTNYNIFTTEKLAKAALAMARISQIRKYDNRFKLIKFNSTLSYYFTICKELINNKLQLSIRSAIKKHVNIIDELVYFNTYDEANLFLEENKELLLDYFAITD